MDVTFSSCPWPRSRRSRTCSAPVPTLRYTSFSESGPRSTLNTEPDGGPSAIASCTGNRDGERVEQLRHAGTGDRGPEQHRVQLPPPSAGPQPLQQNGSVDPAGTGGRGIQHRLVRLGNSLHHGLVEGRAVQRLGQHLRVARTHALDPLQRNTSRGQASPDVVNHLGRSGAHPVHLVHEQHGGNAQPPQCAVEHDGLRLHAFDGGQHQHRAVQDGQRAFDLGDEVRVARGVDQVDGDVTRGVGDHERRHGSADRDATTAFEVHRVGSGVAGIDTARLVEDTRLEQQSLRQAGLASVNMRDDSQIQRTQGPSRPSQRWSVPVGA